MRERDQGMGPAATRRRLYSHPVIIDPPHPRWRMAGAIAGIAALMVAAVGVGYLVIYIVSYIVKGN